MMTPIPTTVTEIGGASMRPRQRCRGNAADAALRARSMTSFNEAAAALPRKWQLGSSQGLLLGGFNEAAAALPRKSGRVLITTRAAPGFNEAAAALPRKCRALAARIGSMVRFNEAAAALPRK